MAKAHLLISDLRQPIADDIQQVRFVRQESGWLVVVNMKLRTDQGVDATVFPEGGYMLKQEMPSLPANVVTAILAKAATELAGLGLQDGDPPEEAPPEEPPE